MENTLIKKYHFRALMLKIHCLIRESGQHQVLHVGDS